MYRDLREVYWWSIMKKGIAEFVAKCLNCQQVKVEHQRPGVDRMTKLTHFLPVKTTHSTEDYAKLYIQEVERLQGVPIFIISDRGAQFTVQFWKSFQRGLGSKIIQERLKITQSRQKSYTDVRRRDLEFEVDDWIYLKVSPMKGVMRFGKKGKLSPRYIGPYRISKRIGNVTYELELPQELAAVHPIFHISMLKKCMGDPSLIIPTEDIGIKDSLSYGEILV
ncbi:hypothetical protein MTR67_035742 [Solanum verrucosum]|uniref:Uncharacterized protein n=1 Tax=Solanum verrucosum TaxID=315347 RepID=A0AAF0UAG0_SOLVR|nr:hypothetical protein MTR67_035742 [Solanum verrucosum]